MDEVSPDDHCDNEVVIVVTPLVKILGVDVSPFPIVGDSLELRSFVPLGKGVDG